MEGLNERPGVSAIYLSTIGKSFVVKPLGEKACTNLQAFPYDQTEAESKKSEQYFSSRPLGKKASCL